jgi:hypothetical protein
VSVAITNSTIPDFESQAHELTRRQLQQWFDWMDHLLDIHRANFVFREASPGELNGHKTALRLALRYCLWMHPLIADPDFNDSQLVGRLEVRIRQLQYAYDTFHDMTLSDEQAEKVVSQVFPE